jgi:hypothetical protein
MSNLQKQATAGRLRRYTKAMKRALAIIVALATLSITGCTGRYTMDMSGLDRASQDTVEPASERLTVSELERVTDSALDETGRKYSMSTLNDLSNQAFDKHTRGR